MFLLLLVILSQLTEVVFSIERSKCGLVIPSEVTTRPHKVIIAHRGASYHLPEHTLAAYQLALELGADYIEPDLVGTKDGHLVAMHSMDLTLSTNVMDIYSSTKPPTFSTQANQTGYWTFDFTLMELQKLTVKQTVQGRSTVYDGLFSIPTLDQILTLLQTWNTHTTDLQSHGTAGIYAELKDPEWYKTQTNMSLASLFHQTVQLNDYYNTSDPEPCTTLKYNDYVIPKLVVQSFDAAALKELHSYIPTIPLVLLMSASECAQEEVWFHVEHHLAGVGPDKSCLSHSKHYEFMILAKEHEVAVHVWTERPEVGTTLSINMTEMEELEYLLCTVGVDGVFTEDIATMRVVVEKGCNNIQPTLAPTLPTSCPPTDKADMSTEYGIAAGIMGVLIGTVATLWLVNTHACTKCCGRKGRGAKRQLSIPQHDDLEMI